MFENIMGDVVVNVNQIMSKRYGLFLVLSLASIHLMSDMFCGKRSGGRATYGSTAILCYLKKCARRCQGWTQCKSIDYFIDTSTCQLNTVNSSGVMTSRLRARRGSVHSSISAWPKSFAGACQDHSCSGDQYCEDVDGAQTCVLI